jgi:hypothetical protein
LTSERRPRLPDQGGVPDPERLDHEARWRPIGTVVVTLPDNPTGTLATAATVQALCAVSERHDLTIVSDEIYRDLTYRAPFASPAEFAAHRTVITTGLSQEPGPGRVTAGGGPIRRPRDARRGPLHRERDLVRARPAPCSRRPPGH